ncbi:secretogranin-1 isoform X5 [Hippocampus zosterae]|uniref:secretogranin-1 isoform X5 n=1 Tax=Hippocampus zosterae TaxID=109293 RepID=UPI00223DD40D|nr:secretogranin-1 isoform X5 [Hippocampus zosterae]
MTRTPLVLLLGFAFQIGNQALPVGKDGQREDVVTRCLVEVLSKSLTHPDAQLDQECKEIFQAGIKHAPLDKNSKGATNEEQPKDHAQDIHELQSAVESNREGAKSERNQESWSLEKRHQGDDSAEEEEKREKRSSWRPGRFHQKRPKRDKEPLGGESKEEERDEERSQESWDLDRRSDDDLEEQDQLIWKPSDQYHPKKKFHKRGDEDYERSQESWGLDDVRDKREWRVGRYHQRRHKRDEEISEDLDGERSQESWDFATDVSKRDWRPGRYHQRRHKRDEELSEVPDEERSQESWDFDSGRAKKDWRPGRYHQRRHKRDEELSEDPEEERSQESWDFDSDRYKRDWRPGRYHQRRHKRDEELSEDPEEERSQESWDFDSDRYKRDWRPGRYHQRRHKRDEELPQEAREEPDEERSQESWDFNGEKKSWRPWRYYKNKPKRDEELSEEKWENSDGDRSQEYWNFDKRHSKYDDKNPEKYIWKLSHQYNHKNKYHKHGGEEVPEDEDLSDDSENPEDRSETLGYLAEKRNPWIYYHPAWFKGNQEEHAAPNKMDEAAKLLSHKIDQLADQEASQGATHPRALTPHEEKALENLATMDEEMKKIAAKLHDKE